jgi:hypothetical protein
MNILLLDAGSSSLKCPLMESADGRVVARGLKIRIKIRSNGSIGKNDSVLDYQRSTSAWRHFTGNGTAYGRSYADSCWTTCRLDNRPRASQLRPCRASMQEGSVSRISPFLAVEPSQKTTDNYFYCSANRMGKRQAAPFTKSHPTAIARTSVSVRTPSWPLGRVAASGRDGLETKMTGSGSGSLLSSEHCGIGRRHGPEAEPQLRDSYPFTGRG